jgi:two-component system cell cycle response regulator CpdR
MIRIMGAPAAIGWHGGWSVNRRRAASGCSRRGPPGAAAARPHHVAAGDAPLSTPMRGRRAFTRSLPASRHNGSHTADADLPPEGSHPGAGADFSGLVTIVMSRIILAEDDGDMRRFLAKALEKAGHEVVSFDNGLSAYERLREEPFTLLLTDIVMPEMDGIELARRATRLDPDLKVMFITGFAAVALNSDSRAPKDAKVLSKPFHLRELVREVERLLAA